MKVKAISYNNYEENLCVGQFGVIDIHELEFYDRISYVVTYANGEKFRIFNPDQVTYDKENEW